MKAIDDPERVIDAAALLAPRDNVSLMNKIDKLKRKTRSS
jgi:hypothetical protein